MPPKQPHFRPNPEAPCVCGVRKVLKDCCLQFDGSRITETISSRFRCGDLFAQCRLGGGAEAGEQIVVDRNLLLVAAECAEPEPLVAERDGDLFAECRLGGGAEAGELSELISLVLERLGAGQPCRKRRWFRGQRLLLKLPDQFVQIGVKRGMTDI